MSDSNESVISIGKWLAFMFASFIPLVNLGVFIYAAVSDSQPESMNNWGKARLIILSVVFTLLLIIRLAAG